ncbi:uncharacterized protein LOC126204309 [Schistocerca nitens]|uniref:uncharacterized protein LOC126204309 n=1 Tax=Schistocerca nitens TaxID=7011 RepID=UPI002119A1A9|nr:uncharacterized protein LOC126204309 [Schistocerca nitens]
MPPTEERPPPPPSSLLPPIALHSSGLPRPRRLLPLHPRLPNKLPPPAGAAEDRAGPPPRRNGRPLLPHWRGNSPPLRLRRCGDRPLRSLPNLLFLPWRLPQRPPQLTMRLSSSRLRLRRDMRESAAPSPPPGATSSLEEPPDQGITILDAASLHADASLDVPQCRLNLHMADLLVEEHQQILDILRRARLRKESTAKTTRQGRHASDSEDDGRPVRSSSEESSAGASDADSESEDTQMVCDPPTTGQDVPDKMEDDGFQVVTNKRRRKKGTTSPDTSERGRKPTRNPSTFPSATSTRNSRNAQKSHVTTDANDGSKHEQAATTSSVPHQRLPTPQRGTEKEHHQRTESNLQR